MGCGGFGRMMQVLPALVPVGACAGCGAGCCWWALLGFSGLMLVGAAGSSGIPMTCGRAWLLRLWSAGLRSRRRQITLFWRNWRKGFGDAGIESLDLRLLRRMRALGRLVRAAPGLSSAVGTIELSGALTALRLRMITAADGCGGFCVGLNRCIRCSNLPFGDFYSFLFLLLVFWHVLFHAFSSLPGVVCLRVAEFV